MVTSGYLYRKKVGVRSIERLEMNVVSVCTGEKDSLPYPCLPMLTRVYTCEVSLSHLESKQREE